ncbi:arf-GAP with coiled-coil, ANK repeat and PH domain-containing protein 2-like [Mercenaria mercenaria]|uniref:arf-GAP with coiled-coil, ANK repeat and PH domain-containing protein 2-like n=1 Tax=Mercenaria mercenaria TaxID=6596 RepID=UPI00234F362F|nr:arf-GAP with coiled-coil, ANK repeat and PH domain-containing protein 2-like [Mercenaria mercenaria]
MKYTLDFKECLKDSPKFRLSLESAESDVESLEAKLDRVVRLCTTMVEAGKSFNNAGCGFITGVKDLAGYFHEDTMVSDNRKVSSCLNHFCQSMSEMLRYFNILMEQAQKTVCKNLSHFIKSEIKKVKDTRKHFEKISDDLDNALSRNSSALRSKPQDCEDAYNLMMANKSCFAHTSLDYVYQINILQSKKRFDVLETMLSFMHAQATFFHQGHELYQDCEGYMNNMGDQVKELHVKAKQEWKEMEERHDLVQNKDVGFKPDVEVENGVHMEGYLFKKTKHAFKAWVRRWFSIEDNQLRYQKRMKDTQVTVMEEDLRLCTVKPAYELDRRFCFEVLSPTRSHMLQAHTEEEFQTWVGAIQSGVTKAFRAAEKRQSDAGLNESTGSSKGRNSSTDLSVMDSPAPDTENKKSKAQIQMEKLYSIPGNSKCCDCGSPDPRWASINLGITLCIECSGIHSSFMFLSCVAVMSVTASKDTDSGVVPSPSEGSDVSAEKDETVGGTEADTVQSNAEDVIVFGTEFNLPDFQLDISSESSGTEEDAKSTTSWEDMSTLDPNMLLFKAAQARNLAVMLEAIANGAETNWVNTQEDDKTPLMKAIETGSLSACEFLLLNRAKLDKKDRHGRTPLHLATMLGNTGQVCQFLKRGAQLNVQDNEGKDPLSIAVSAANADIVTLLRLAKLNEEMKESDDYLGANPGDETFNDVFRDFTNMASNNPEKLKRNK